MLICSLCVVTIGVLPYDDPNQGIVDLSACASFLDDFCIREYTIPMKNCGNYNVYCLYPVQDSHDRFCMGTTYLNATTYDLE